MIFGPHQRFNLFDIVKGFGGLGTTGLSIHLARQILLAVRDFHRRQIAHKDLKLEVIRIDEEYGARIGGLSHCMPTHGSDQRPRPTKHRGGTRAYAAPEAFEKKEHNPAKADMWSLGVLLFILVVGRPPCRVASDEDPWFSCIKRGSKAEMDVFWSRHLKASKIKIDPHAVHFRQLIEGLLQVDPMRRLEAAAVVKHPWICKACPTQEICQGLLRYLVEQLHKNTAFTVSSYRPVGPVSQDGAASKSDQQATGGARRWEAVEEHAAGAEEEHAAGVVEEHAAGAEEEHAAGAEEEHAAGAEEEHAAGVVEEHAAGVVEEHAAWDVEEHAAGVVEERTSSPGWGPTMEQWLQKVPHDDG